MNGYRRARRRHGYRRFPSRRGAKAHLQRFRWAFAEALGDFYEKQAQRVYVKPWFYGQPGGDE